jgi:hypothetical protein
MAEYGPARPEPKNALTRVQTHPYLRRYATKMRNDLIRRLRLYDGRTFRLFRSDATGGRCTTCTDAFTGQILLSNCPECMGTGNASAFSSLGDFQVWTDIDARVRESGEMGNFEAPRGGTDTFVVVGAPILKDDDLLILKDTREVYKIDDVEPKVMALGGEVILQMAPVFYVTPGSKEYELINW